MSAYRTALFDAFSESTLGGSVAAIVADAGDLDCERMQRIARELGAPATAFIIGIDDSRIDVRFFSTLTEYPKCGHGTVGLLTWLVERGVYVLDEDSTRSVTLATPAGAAPVEVRRREDGRTEVMLTLDAVDFEPSPLGAAEIAPALGVETDAFVPDSPVEWTHSEFTHVVARIRGLDSMRAMAPDFGAIAAQCRRIGADTSLSSPPRPRTRPTPSTAASSVPQWELRKPPPPERPTAPSPPTCCATVSSDLPPRANARCLRNRATKWAGPVSFARSSAWSADGRPGFGSGAWRPRAWKARSTWTETRDGRRPGGAFRDA